MNALNRLEMAIVNSDIDGAIASFDEGCRAAYDEGVQGIPFVPAAPERPKDTPRPKRALKGEYRVLAAKGLWANLPAMKLPEPFIVMKPGGKTIHEAIAICLSTEDAERVAAALEACDG